MVLHKTGTLGRSRRPGSIPGSGVTLKYIFKDSINYKSKLSSSNMKGSKDAHKYGVKLKDTTTYFHEKPSDGARDWSTGGNCLSSVEREYIVQVGDEKVLAFDHYYQHGCEEAVKRLMVPGFIIGELRKYNPMDKNWSKEDTGHTLVREVKETEKIEVEKQLQGVAAYFDKGIEYWKGTRD